MNYGFEAEVGFVGAHRDALELLELAEEVLDQMTPFVHLGIERNRLGAALMQLLALTESPVVALNRAVAIAEVEGPRAAFAALDAITRDKRMAEYQPYWAARGQICAQRDMTQEAHRAFSLAMGLSSDPAVRAYLRGRLRGG